MFNRRTCALGVIALAMLFAALAVVQPAAASGPDPNAVLFVKKTAYGSQDTTWTWTIAKAANVSDLTLSPGQVHVVDYAVTVDAASATGWTVVSGTGQSDGIAFRNLSAGAVQVTSVVDQLSDGTIAAVSCPFTLPYSLPAGFTSPPCSYTASGNGPAPTSNTVTVSLSDGTSYSATVPVNYTSSNETDECITVNDSLAGALGTVCAGEAPRTFEYSYAVGPYDTCGLYHVDNIASFVTNDTGTTGSANWTVNVTVPCVAGCTLTQGYWKTHSEFGPAPYDATWALLPTGASTSFYLSGQTWYEVFWTPPAGGNRYYQLAHQFMAARLNVLNGAATTSEVDAALAWAEAFFNTYTPTSALSPAVRSAATSNASILDSYNNGVTGPGHCSE